MADSDKHDEAPTEVHADLGESAEAVKAAAEDGEARGKRSKERAAGTDVRGLATHTTTLVDTARPFVLGVAAIVFVVLGFFESDSATAQMFVFGGILTVVGAAFSDEITAYVTARIVKQPGCEDADESA